MPSSAEEINPNQKRMGWPQRDSLCSNSLWIAFTSSWVEQWAVQVKVKGLSKAPLRASLISLRVGNIQ